VVQIKLSVTFCVQISPDPPSGGFTSHNTLFVAWSLQTLKVLCIGDFDGTKIWCSKGAKK
jgi:hypothetical protein